MKSGKDYTALIWLILSLVAIVVAVVGIMLV